jgi:hypothetical protein
MRSNTPSVAFDERVNVAVSVSGGKRFPSSGGHGSVVVSSLQLAISASGVTQVPLPPKIGSKRKRAEPEQSVASLGGNSLAK